MNCKKLARVKKKKQTHTTDIYRIKKSIQIVSVYSIAVRYIQPNPAFEAPIY